jgi:hypothetical protein
VASDGNPGLLGKRPNINRPLQKLTGEVLQLPVAKMSKKQHILQTALAASVTGIFVLTFRRVHVVIVAVEKQ